MSFILKQKKPKQGSGNGVAIARVRGDILQNTGSIF
jgi:hypothetical protein